MAANNAHAPKNEEIIELSDADLVEIKEEDQPMFTAQEVRTLVEGLDIPEAQKPVPASAEENLPEAEIIEDETVSEEVQATVSDVLKITRELDRHDLTLQGKFETGSENVPEGAYCVSGNTEGNAEGSLGKGKFYALSVNGNEKEQNDDGFYVDPENNLVCVADGLGGYAKGFVATNVLMDYLMRNRDNLSGKSLNEIMKEADNQIRSFQKRNQPLDKTSTVAVMSRMLADGNLEVCSCGDSVFKLFRGGKIVQSSNEDNMLNAVKKTHGYSTKEEMMDFFTKMVTNEAKEVLKDEGENQKEDVEKGRQILEDPKVALQAATDRYKEFQLRLTQALGGDKNLDLENMTTVPQIFPETTTIHNPQEGDIGCYFSDGVTDNADDEEIAAILQNHLSAGKSLGEAAQALKDYIISIMQTKEGKNDNITILLWRIK